MKFQSLYFDICHWYAFPVAFHSHLATTTRPKRTFPSTTAPISFVNFFPRPANFINIKLFNRSAYTLIERIQRNSRSDVLKWLDRSVGAISCRVIGQFGQPWTLRLAGVRSSRIRSSRSIRKILARSNYNRSPPVLA